MNFILIIRNSITYMLKLNYTNTNIKINCKKEDNFVIRMSANQVYNFIDSIICINCWILCVLYLLWMIQKIILFYSVDDYYYFMSLLTNNIVYIRCILSWRYAPTLKCLVFINIKEAMARFLSFFICQYIYHKADVLLKRRLM